MDTVVWTPGRVRAQQRTNPIAEIYGDTSTLVKESAPESAVLIVQLSSIFKNKLLMTSVIRVQPSEVSHNDNPRSTVQE